MSDVGRAKPQRRRALRHVVDCLPYETRVAMLEGLQRYDRIIVGAYSDRSGGVCPMLAAHRCGGRTDFRSFARAWDRFTGAGGRAAHAQRARAAHALTRQHRGEHLARGGDARRGRAQLARGSPTAGRPRPMRPARARRRPWLRRLFRRWDGYREPRYDDAAASSWHRAPRAPSSPSASADCRA